MCAGVSLKKENGRAVNHNSIKKDIQLTIMHWDIIEAAHVSFTRLKVSSGSDI